VATGLGLKQAETRLHTILGLNCRVAMLNDKLS